MEETRNETMNEVENTELVPVNDYQPETEEEGSVVVPIIIGGLLVSGVAAGAAFAWKKLKGKSEERQLKKLKKKGYTIIPPEEDSVNEELVSDSEKSEEK